MRCARILLLALLLSACHWRRKSKIRKIEFAQGTCLGPCVPMAISIDSALKFTYFADSSFSWSKPKHSKVNYISKANRKLWEELVSRLEDMDYQHFKPSTRVEPMDVQQMELIVYFDRTKIRITREGDRIDAVMKLIIQSPTQIKLQTANEKLYFGTTLQQVH